MGEQLPPQQLGCSGIEFDLVLPENEELVRSEAAPAKSEGDIECLLDVDSLVTPNRFIARSSPASRSSRSPTREVKQTHEDDHTKFRDAVEVTMNPFVNTPRLTCYEFLKRFTVGLTLFPLRLVLLICVVLAVIVWARLVMIGMPLVEDRGCWMHKKPLPCWRSRLAVPIRYLFRIFLWCHGLLWIKVTDHRKHRLIDPNIVVAGPHVTMFDMFVMMCIFPDAGFLGQAAVVKNPLLLPMATITQGLYIDLQNKGGRRSCKEAVAMRASPDWQGGKLIIFPEGTITNGQQLVQFRAGAFSPGTPLLPVLLRYPWQSFDVSWVGQNRDYLWAVRCALQVVNYCEVEILEVYFPSDEEQDNAILFANNVRRVMAKHAGLPTTEHSYEDVLFYRESALRAKVGHDFVIKEMKNLLNADMETLKAWLELFKKVDKDNVGSLSMYQLQSVLKPDAAPEEMHCLFNFFDTDQSGRIEYREFVQMLALISGKSTGNDLAKLAFFLYDTNNEGFVDKQLLTRALNNAQGLYENIQDISGLTNRETHKEQDVSRGRFSDSDLDWSPKGRSSFEEFSDQISWQDFCEILQRKPEVLEAAVGEMRRSIKAVGVGPVRSIRELAQSVTATSLGKDQKKQNEAVVELSAEEGLRSTSSCPWQF